MLRRRLTFLASAAGLALERAQAASVVLADV